MHHEQDDKHNRGQRKRDPRVIIAERIRETLRRRFLLLRHFNHVKNPAKCALPQPARRGITDWPSRLSVPPLTASPICFTTGIASPVKADSSADVAPSIITPSTGKSSPGFTSNSFPICTSSIAASTQRPSSRRNACFGATLSNDSI